MTRTAGTEPQWHPQPAQICGYQILTPRIGKESGLGHMLDITQLLKLPWEGAQVRSEELSSGSAFPIWNDSGVSNQLCMGSESSPAWGANPALLPTPTAA